MEAVAKNLSNILLYSIIPMLLVFDYFQRNVSTQDLEWYVYFISDKTLIFVLMSVIAITNKNKVITYLLLILFAHELYQVIRDTTHNGVQLTEVYVVAAIVEGFIIVYYTFKIQINKYIKRWLMMR